VRLSLLGTSATIWLIVPVPDDGWWWVCCSRWTDGQGTKKYSQKTCPSAAFSTTNPTWPDSGSNPVHCGGKPATNRLSWYCHMKGVNSQINYEYLEISLWSSGRSSWLQIQRSGFDSRRYQIFWEVVDLERGPLSLVSTVEERLVRRRSGSGLESREYASREPSRWPRGTLHRQKLSLTSPTSGGHSVGIIRSRIQATEFSFSLEWPLIRRNSIVGERTI
jgi:hypothetical protein